MIGSVGVILAAASMQIVPACSWDRPGANPYMGDVPAAVERYRDIPAATRAKLRAKMQRRQYDDVATIARDGIESKSATYTNLRDMHFGGNRLCRTVTTAKWTPAMQERGLVYCADDHCVIVPTVCRNVSRVDATPRPPAKPPADTPAPGADSGPVQPPTLAEATPAAPGSFNDLQGPVLGPPEAPPAPELGPGGGPFVHYVPVPLPLVIGGGSPPLIHTVEPPPSVIPVPPAPIPEPSILALLAAGLGLIVYRRWR